MAMETFKSHDEEKKVLDKTKNPEQSDKQGQQEKKMEVIQAKIKIIRAQELLEQKLNDYDLVLRSSLAKIPDAD